MTKNKKIAIYGFGKEGVSAANFLGQNNDVSIIDDKTKKEIDPIFFSNLRIKNVKFYFDSKYPKDLNFDLIVRSPGVQFSHPFIQKALKKGITLTSPTKIFFDLCPCPIVGVTGTKGKGTTASLIHRMLETQSSNVYLAGNIGIPALDILPKLTRASIVVLELSSFQLLDLKKSPHIAVVLMLTSEHLDWHKDTYEYREAKESIVAYQAKNDFAVINQDFQAAKSFSQKTKAQVYFFSTENQTNGTYLSADKIISNIEGPEEICKTSQILLPGKHNLQNVLAAVAVAKIQNIKKTNIVKVLSTFKGLAHRLQLVGEIDEVKFINDSYSTIPETTIAAIDAFENPKILILGGSSKNSNFTSLGRTINQDDSIKTILLIGREAKRIKEAITAAGGTKANILEGAKNMRQIVNLAKSCAQPGDIIVLSPACASFDMFKNYQDRGEKFALEVENFK
ncbi:UDP-N-acetylmuramoylalanine--D-glutamate ligase [Candidatus Curtissbacteria bacterium RIFCSPHIGHO2_12_FULL_41_13]|nr:MAG: UDP-N-acetylmuramoylalanine--D-glutamate ligase [Candidatus Curtissbacteria bacterium RIFCSPHIGHO2_12_FULL_41_13]